MPPHECPVPGVRLAKRERNRVARETVGRLSIVQFGVEPLVALNANHPNTDDQAIVDGVLIPLMANRRDTAHRMTVESITHTERASLLSG